MPTDEFEPSGSQQTFDVPDYFARSSATARLRLFGGGGEDGSVSGDYTHADVGEGAPGGYIEADLPVSADETLYVYVDFDAGVGVTAGAGSGGNSINAIAGDGGGWADVRQGGSSQGDRVAMVAGGGGGGAAAIRAPNPGDVDIDGADGGSGGGDGDDGDFADVLTNADRPDGGDGGDASGDQGEGSQTATDVDSDVLIAASSGAGGGGENGGEAGQAELVIDADGASGGANLAKAGAGGGGGGDGLFTSACDNTFELTGGGNTGDPLVTIEYSQPITDLSVSAAGENTILLSWSAIDDAFEYNVLRASASGSTASDYETVATIDGDRTSFADTGLTDGERYYYRIESVFTNTEDVISNEATAVVEMPRATWVDMVITQYNPVSPATGNLQLEWKPNDANPAGGWEVWRSTTEGSLGSQIGTITDANASTFVDQGVSAETEYWYTIRRVGPHSHRDSTQRLGGVTNPPKNVTVDAVNGDQLTAGWSDDSTIETAYNVYVSNDNGKTWVQDNDDPIAADATSYETSHLRDGERYFVKVEVVVGLATIDSTDVEPVDVQHSGSITVSATVSVTESVTSTSQTVTIEDFNDQDISPRWSGDTNEIGYETSNPIEGAASGDVGAEPGQGDITRDNFTCSQGNEYRVSFRVPEGSDSDPWLSINCQQSGVPFASCYAARVNWGAGDMDLIEFDDNGNETGRLVDGFSIGTTLSEGTVYQLGIKIESDGTKRPVLYDSSDNVLENPAGEVDTTWQGGTVGLHVSGDENLLWDNVREIPL